MHERRRNQVDGACELRRLSVKAQIRASLAQVLQST